MLSTGNQLRAARALVAIDQGGLAEMAGVNINTIGSMEKRGAAGLTSGLDVVRRVQSALEAAGIEFLNHGRPGVRLREGVALASTGGMRKSAGEVSASADAAREQAADALDQAMVEIDASGVEKTERRELLTNVPEVVVKARRNVKRT